jgi:uncharacterized membrane protein
VSRWRARTAPARLLAWAGRWSLPIYLIHQPVLLALLYGVLQVTGPHPEAQARTFVGQCAAECAQTNGNPAFCRSVCTCIGGRLRESGSFGRVQASGPSAEDQSRVLEAAQACRREAAP